MLNNNNTIGKYRIIEEIASGASGRVYRAQDTSMNNRIVAIKLMHAAHLRSAQEHDSFLQEAQFLKILQHPHILPVLDVGIEQSFPYFVMEYAPHGSLYDRLKQLAPRPLLMQEALAVLGQIGQALQYAHQQNIIHRDLKPANILLNANGEALLADFGLATMLATSMKYGTAIGTPYYMAPEQFRGSISKEADQYALGCIAYELLTGRVPFTAPDFFALGHKHMTETPVPPTQLNLLLPHSFEQAILKAMAKQRTDRHADIAAFMNALGIPTLTQVRPSITISSTPGTIRVQVRDNEETIADSYSTVRYEPVFDAPRQDIVAPAPQQHTKEEMSSSQAAPRTINREETGKLMAIGPRNTPPAPRTIEREETGKLMIVGVAHPKIIDREAGGKVFSPADSLPRVIEGSPSEHLPTAPQVATAQVDSDGMPFILSGIHSQRTRRKGRSARSKWLIAASIALLLVLLSGGVLYAMSGNTNINVFGSHLSTTTHPGSKTSVPTPASLSQATVIITPARNNLDSTFKIFAVTGIPDTSQYQVQARILSSGTLMQSKTVPATGKGTTPATPAKGTLRLGNDSTSTLSFSAGQVYTDGNGIQIVTDQGGTVPAGDPSTPTWQYVTVPAHAAQAGSAGNIQQHDINQSSSYGDGTFSVDNEAAFSGGSDAQSYTYVQASDMSNAANELKASLTSQGQSAVSKQVQANESMISSAACTPHITYDHQAGDQATSVTTSVSVICKGEVYDRQTALSMGETLLKNKVFSPYQSYAIVGQVTTTLVQASVVNANGTIALFVQATAVGVFQFSDAQKQAMAKLIIGNSEQYAETLLLKQTGVGQILIKISGGDGHTLPVSADRIKIVVVDQGAPVPVGV